MNLRTPTADLLAREFAEATAAGDLERAEGWLAVARAVASRDADRLPRKARGLFRTPRLAPARIAVA